MTSDDEIIFLKVPSAESPNLKVNVECLAECIEKQFVT